MSEHVCVFQVGAWNEKIKWSNVAWVICYKTIHHTLIIVVQPDEYLIEFQLFKFLVLALDVHT